MVQRLIAKDKARGAALNNSQSEVPKWFHSFWSKSEITVIPSYKLFKYAGFDKLHMLAPLKARN